MQLSAISLAITRLGFVWNPMQLFSNSEQGAWYDPSDLSTLFQDSAGTIAAVVDQPVGLSLDKSKGLVLGAELSAYTEGAQVASGGGTAQITGSVIASGKSYFVKIPTGLYLNGPTGWVAQPSPGNRYMVVANASAPFSVLNLTGSPITLTGITIKELPGNHAKQATSTKRGTSKSTGAAKWIDYDAIDDVLDVTFPSSLGLACTVGIANVGAPPTILTAQSIGTSYAMSTDNAGLVIVNRALTASETAALTTYLTAKGAT